MRTNITVKELISRLQEYAGDTKLVGDYLMLEWLDECDEDSEPVLVSDSISLRN